MKGKLLVFIGMAFCICLAVIMSIIGMESFSSGDKTPFDTLLKSFLIAVFGILIIMAFTHPKKRKVLTIVFKNVELRFQHMLAYSAVGFYFVNSFGVNSIYKWEYIAHLIFTGISIILLYVTMLLYADDKNSRLWTYIGLAFGSILFMLGIGFNLYTTSYAELFVLLPIVTFFILTYKIIRK